MLQALNVDKTYKQNIQALNQASLTMNSGELVSIHGASGCGKTTFLLCCGGLLKPQAGTVQINQTDIYQLSHNQRAAFRAQHIGFVFQQFHLIPYLTAKQNILTADLGSAQENAEKRADELLELIGLNDRASHKPAELSAGQNQRIAVARALFHKPALILADEPTGNLDPESGAGVLDLLKQCSEKTAVLVVSHDERLQTVATRSYHMQNGALSE